MTVFSRTAAAGVLLTCFLFGMLLAMTGVGKPRKVSLTSNDEMNRLRGANDIGHRSMEASNDELDTSPPKIVGAANPSRVNVHDVESMVWPEQEAESRGFWGPDDEELAQLKGDELVWPEQRAETKGLWDPDQGEKDQVAQLLAGGKWDELIAIDEDSALSFSFIFT